MFIDVHAHIGWIAQKTGQRPSQTPGFFISAEDVVRNMDRYGIDKACVLPLSDCPEGDYLASSTEEVIAACARYPERLVPFCLVHPRFGANRPDTDFSALLADYKARGCVALGEMVANLWIDDPFGVNLWRQAGEAGLPVLFDMTARVDTHYGVVDDPGLPRLERVLQDCPNTIFIGAHVGTLPEELHTVGNWLDVYPNFYIDIDARISELGRQPRTTRKFLLRYQDKIMFGTDTPPSKEAYQIYYRFLETDDEYFDPSGGHHLQGRWMIYGVYLPDDVLEKIYNSNAQKIFGMFKGV